MGGFIPMPHALGSQAGAAPVLYMPVTGPNGEQGFAPVYQQPPSMFPGSCYLNCTLKHRQHFAAAIIVSRPAAQACAKLVL